MGTYEIPATKRSAHWSGWMIIVGEEFAHVYLYHLPGTCVYIIRLASIISCVHTLFLPHILGLVRCSSFLLVLLLWGFCVVRSRHFLPLLHENCADPSTWGRPFLCTNDLGSHPAPATLAPVPHADLIPPEPEPSYVTLGYLIGH